MYKTTATIMIFDPNSKRYPTKEKKQILSNPSATNHRGPIRVTQN